MSYKILIPGYISKEGLDLLKAEQNIAVDHREDVRNNDELLKIIADYDVLFCVNWTRVDEELLARAKRLRLVGRMGVGTEKIDIKACTQHDVLVFNDPDGNTASAAEQTMALMLSAARHTWRACNAIKGGEFRQEKYFGKELNGKTLGIVGLGRIGSRVARFAQAFGMSVVCYDPYIPKEKAESVGAELLANLDELTTISDFITVHTPLTDETKGMINEHHFGLMRNGVVIINCARGGIINEKALYENLLSGKVYAAGVDVWSCEPIESNSYPNLLLPLPNLVGTPHLGAKTFEAQDRVGVNMARQTIRALQGELIENALNTPESWSQNKFR